MRLKLISSNWLLTLTATLFGVSVALFLNEWVASNKFRSQKSIATENIVAEVTVTHEKLKKLSKDIWSCST